LASFSGCNLRGIQAQVMNLYVYCFCSAPAPEVLDTIGILDSEVIAIEYDNVIAIAADCSRLPDASVPNLVAHNRVIRSVLKATTPVPCRFGTMLGWRDLEAYVRSNGEALRSLLDRIRGCVEMTLRVDSIEGGAHSQCEDIQAPPGILPEQRGPGTRFLEAKLLEASRQNVAVRKTQAILDWVDSRFGALVKERVARMGVEAPAVTRIGHLLDRTRIEQYRELFGVAQNDRPDLVLSISGPWAPYSFAVFEKSAHEDAVRGNGPITSLSPTAPRG
jgi:hypothetical protein